MTDQVANETDGGADSTDEPGASGDETGGGDPVGGLDAPGGGPRRVVSEDGVDDILASLNDPADGDSLEASSDTGSDSRPAEGATEPRATETESDENDGTTVGESPPADESAGSGTAAAASTRPAAERGESTATGESTRDDAATDDLADRVDAGDVTGADVRAAETDDGREATPSVDEIDLSLDDLDTGDAVAPASTDADERTESGDGPLGGSGGASADATETPERDRDAGAGAHERDDGGVDGEPAGLLGRIRSFFAR